MSAPPKRKPANDIPTFPDPEEHTNLKALYREIRKTLLAIELPRGDDRRRLIEFVGVLNPGAFHDPGRLPYESSTGRSKRHRHESCLLAFISKLVQDYWWLVLDEREPVEKSHTTTAEVRAQLDQLKRFVEKGINRCRIIGDEHKGFELAC